LRKTAKQKIIFTFAQFFTCFMLSLSPTKKTNNMPTFSNPLWGVIINPTSSKKVLRQLQNELLRATDSARIPTKICYTQHEQHATQIARELVEAGVENILVVGGDGTLNEVVNGIYTAPNIDLGKLTIAIIPSGTGNDWARYWQLNRGYKTALEVFLQGHTTAIDIGKAEFERNGEVQQRYFINSFGLGFDHKVVHETNRIKRYLGSHAVLYFVAVLRSVFLFKAQELTIKTADTSYTGNVFSMNVGNGCYSGGGMKQNPTAIPTDGLFNAMYVLPLTPRDIFVAIQLLFNGKLTTHPRIKTLCAPEIEIAGTATLPFETDGVEGLAGNHVKVSVLHHSIRMVVPAGW
jgi:diacylglycerol kinase (ATP)